MSRNDLKLIQYRILHHTVTASHGALEINIGPGDE